MHGDTNNLNASLRAVAIVSCASPFVLFVFRGAQLRAQIRSSKFGLNFQTHTDSLSDGQKVGPKVWLQHSRANKHSQGWPRMVIPNNANIYWCGVSPPSPNVQC